MTKFCWIKNLNTFCYLTMRKNQTYKNSLYVGTGILLRNGNKLMSIQRKDKKIELSWQLENSNRYQIECSVHISNTIIIIALFTKSLETMTLMYSRKIDNNNSHDKTTTSKAWYSRNNSSDDNNLHTNHYKQGKWQPDVAPRGDERQERMRAEKEDT
jgi:hypothetical protein